MMNHLPATDASASQPSLFGLNPANPYPAFAKLRALGAVVPVPLPVAF